MKALALLGFLLLLFSNTINASAPVPPVCQPGFPWSSIPIQSSGTGLELALLALTVSFDVVAIAYALSRLFPNTGIKNWLQTEYWEIAKTAIIIVVIFAAITFIANLSYLLVPSVVQSPITLSNNVADITPLIAGAEGYLCGVNTQLVNTWEEFGILSAGTGFWSTLQVGFYIPIPALGPYIAFYDGITFLPFANWLLQTGNYFIAPYGSIINDLINFVLFPFSSITLGLITTLPSLAYVGLTFFIPLGLLFRAFPFIRGIGGTIIAIGLALCLVMPSVFILFNYEVTSVLSSTLPIVQPAPSFVNLNLRSCNAFGILPGIIGTVACTGINLLLSSINSVAGFTQSIWYALPVFQTNAIYTYMDRIMRYGIYIIIQVLLFALDLMIMYPLVDGIAKSMGGTIRLSIGGKLRLAS